AAHELLHALGAVPAGAPHECAAPESRHACDSKLDIMYPYVAAGGIDGLFLDVGHDDYYGNGGASDVRKSPWLEHLDVPHAPLNVATTGAGRVLSDAGAIDCPGACATAQEQGLVVTLKARPAAGSHFVRWNGACSGTRTCS